MSDSSVQTEIVFSVLTGIEAGGTTAHPDGLPMTGCVAHVSPRFGIAAWYIFSVDLSYYLTNSRIANIGYQGMFKSSS